MIYRNPFDAFHNVRVWFFCDEWMLIGGVNVESKDVSSSQLISRVRKGNARSSSVAVSGSVKPVYSGTARLKMPDSSSGSRSKKARYAGYVSWVGDDDEVEEVG